MRLELDWNGATKTSQQSDNVRRKAEINRGGAGDKAIHILKGMY